MNLDSQTMRIDKWLWVARMCKTRGQAQKLVSGGHLRLDGAPMTKPHRQVRHGNVLTFSKGDMIRVIKVIGMAARRGKAVEAQCLYEDLTPPPPPREEAMLESVRFFEKRDVGQGRPTKRDRRQTDRLKD